MDIVLVAAIGENNVIGVEGKLPWHISSDLKHFRALTLNKPVIMGRKTYESIGKPLDQRTNIVVSRNLARVIGLRGVKRVQQSWSGIIDMGYVPSAMA